MHTQKLIKHLKECQKNKQKTVFSKHFKHCSTEVKEALEDITTKTTKNRMTFYHVDVKKAIKILESHAGDIQEHSEGKTEHFPTIEVAPPTTTKKEHTPTVISPDTTKKTGKNPKKEKKPTAKKKKTTKKTTAKKPKTTKKDK